jgi:intraflagellar transport protein 74
MRTAGRQAAIGQTLNQDIQVSDRPVTGQGMMGMRTGSRGPGRSVQDRSYFLGLFRNKVGEITTEINSMKAQRDQFAKDSTQISQLERTYEMLLKEVRHHEGQLADYNLALDKQRTSTDPMEIHQVAEQLIAENKENERRVDQVFEQRQEAVDGITKCEQEIQQVRAESERKMNAMAPDMLDRYKALQVQNQELLKQIAEKQEVHDKVMGDLQAAERQVAADRWKSV